MLRFAPGNGCPHGRLARLVADFEERLPLARLAPHAEQLAVAALVQEVDVEPHPPVAGEALDGQHVEAHLDVAHRIDVAVEVDVTVDHAVLDEALGLDRADFAGLLGRRRLVDNRLVVGASHPREVDGRARREVNHRPLRDGPRKFVPRGVAERKVTRREHPSVLVNPRGDGVVGILLRALVDLDGHAREDPRVVVGIERIDAEALAVGVGTRHVEDGDAQRRERRPQGKVHILRLDPI